ncbi:TetR/AcrR family transcriptional regulator [Mucilaginibacter paludis]|uniref:Transcriptional regulator, TetR family n=1 Tax=Mucilaginibacter paludis DSM 18603 TaxID=714943 RepID=H1Y5W6_9SPHI|nr:TetR/AcrR family transcriptional regulator [Mucilaginibacter paludis]EHQ30388.1 transcriptional regulator, TetR family [Mucilaginibacter paludis DSM 18603]
METPVIITKKAHDLFLKYGVRSVTMDDIATEVGISKKTIYKFFENKDALVENFIEEAIAENEESCRTFISKNNNPVVELFFTLMVAQKLYQDLNKPILNELEKNHHKAYLAVKQHKDGFIFQTIKTSIENGINKQLYQADVNPALMSRFFLESLLLISDTSIFSSTTYHTTTLSEEIFGHLISGIATSAGTNLINRYKNQHRFIRGTQTLTRPFWED